MISTNKNTILTWALCAFMMQILLLSSEYFHCYICFAPLAATCVLLFFNPESSLAQPRNILLSYIIAGGVGFVANLFFDFGIFVQMCVMLLTLFFIIIFNLNHPPAIAFTFLLSKSHFTVADLVVPLIQLLIILLIAYLFVNFALKKQYPVK